MGNQTLQDIEVSSIAPNPHNPRLIFDEEELDDLKKSIKKVGILVPLTVYKNNKKHPSNEYIILDGERRWRSAKELGLSTIPANIIDEPKDITQNILFMFNIHHFREEWALFPTALKLEVIINRLDTDNEKTLSEFTGVNRSTIRRCKKLLWYPKQYRDILMEKGGKVSTDFFIELYPIAHRLSYESKYDYNDGLDTFIDSCIGIFKEQEIITDVKEFREIRKAMGYYDKKDDFNTFTKLINSFINGEMKGLEAFENSHNDEDVLRKNLLKYMHFLNINFDKINIDQISDIEFESTIKTLQNKLDEIIENID